MRLRLKELREERGLSTTELARLAGVSRGYISLIENGQRQINARLLEALSKALRCSPVDLIDDGSLSPDIIEHLKVLNSLSAADRQAVIRHASSLFSEGDTSEQ